MSISVLNRLIWKTIFKRVCLLLFLCMLTALVPLNPQCWSSDVPPSSPPNLSSSGLAIHTLQFGAVHGTPIALELGQMLGGFFGYTYTPLTQFPSFRTQIRLQIGELVESNRNWEVSHLETHGSSLLGWQFQLGRAGLTLWLGGGGSLVNETRLRHQAQRLTDSNRDLNQTATLLTSHLSSELELELPLSNQIGLLMRGGSQLRWTDYPWGWTVHLGVFWRLDQ